jgi:Nucleotidyl transferase AbiEii toxin, Type IV TA system
MSERRYDTPPKNKASLEQRLRNLIGDDALQLRARRQIGYIAVIAALGTHARDENGEPIFAVKGGVAVELLIGQEARATKDLDSAVRAQAEQIESLLRDALARGWDGFSFRLVSWEPIHDTAAWRGDIKLQFKGQPFSTVQFEAAPAEGDAGRGTQLVDNTFVDVAALGLSPVGELPLVTLAYMLAQKLHACTDHSLPNRENDRARDLIDILLVRRLLADDELRGVRRACVEIFRLRNKHPWPPSITILPEWPAIYASELAKTPGFTPADVEQAAAARFAIVHPPQPHAGTWLLWDAPRPIDSFCGQARPMRPLITLRL